MDYFSNKDFTNYLRSISYVTRNQVFMNISMNKIKFQNAIRQIGALTKVKIERLSPHVLEKYRSNNSCSSNTNPLSRKKDREKHKKSSYSSQKFSTKSLVESSSSNVESKDKENRLSSANKLEESPISTINISSSNKLEESSIPTTNISSSNKLEEPSISTINEETDLRIEEKEEVISFSPEYKSVLNVENKTYSNKNKTQQKPLLLDKHSDRTKSHKSNLMPDKLSQIESTKESSSSKIGQNKIDTSKVNMMNQKPNDHKQKLKIINLFGDCDENEIKIPPHKKIYSEEVKKNVKNNTKQDKNTIEETNKMRRKSICVISEEQKKQTSVGDSSSKTKDTTVIRSSLKTKDSREEIGGRQKSIQRVESNEEEKRTRLKSRDKDASSSSETKMVRRDSFYQDSSAENVKIRKNRSKTQDTEETPLKSGAKMVRQDSIHQKNVPSEDISLKSDKIRTKSDDKNIRSLKSLDKEEISTNSSKIRHKSCFEENSDKKQVASKIRMRRKTVYESVFDELNPLIIERNKSSNKNYGSSRPQTPKRRTSLCSEAKSDLQINSAIDNSRMRNSLEKIEQKTKRDKSTDSSKSAKSITEANVRRKSCYEEKSRGSKEEIKRLQSRDKGHSERSEPQRKKSISSKNDLEAEKDLKKSSKEIICKEDSKIDNLFAFVQKNKSSSSNEKRRCSEDASLGKDHSATSSSLAVQRSSSAATSSKLNLTEYESISKTSFGKRRKSSNQKETANNSRSSSTTSLNKSTSSDLNLSQNESSTSKISLDKRRKSTSQKETANNSRSSSTTSLNKSTSSDLNLSQNESSTSKISLNKRRKSTSQKETANNSRSSSTTSLNKSTSSELNLSQNESSTSKIYLNQRRKSTSQKETANNSRSSSTTSLNKSTSSELNLSQNESSTSQVSLYKRRKSTSQKETINNSISSSTTSLNKSTSSELNLSSDESSTSKISFNKRRKSISQTETPNSSRHSSKVKIQGSATEKSTSSTSEKKDTTKTHARIMSVCNGKQVEQKTMEDKKKDSLKAQVRRKSVCGPQHVEMSSEKSSSSPIGILRKQFLNKIENNSSVPQTPKRQKSICSESDSDTSSNKNLQTIKRKIFASNSSTPKRELSVAKEDKSSTIKRRSTIVKEDKPSTPKRRSSLAEKDKPVPHQISKRRITIHQENFMEQILEASTPKRQKKEKRTMRRSLSINSLPEYQEAEEIGVKRKIPLLIIDGSSDDSSNCEESPNKRNKAEETPTLTKNYINYGDLLEQMKTVHSTPKTIDFVDPLSNSTAGFTKPNYNNDKNQEMTYDSILVVEEKENTPLKLVVRRRSVHDVEASRNRIISRRHSFHFDEIKPKVEPEDSDEEENIPSVKQESQDIKVRSKSITIENAKNLKESLKSNKKPQKIQLRRKSVHEIRTPYQPTSDVKPIKSILKKRSLDPNETTPNRDSNVPNSSYRKDRNDNNITPRSSLPVTIDLENIDIDQIFPTNNNENGLTLEISSDVNCPTSKEDRKFNLSIDSAICSDFANDVEKELEGRISARMLKSNHDLLKSTKELSELKFITTQEAIGVTKSHFVSLFYIYKQYFKMREQVEYEKTLGMDPNLVIKMDYFAKRRESDLKKMYQKLIIFKVDNFIIVLFFEHLAKLLKDEFKKYKDISEVVIYYFIQRIVWILMENFTSPSDEKCLFNHITSCECVEHLMAKGEKYLRYATAKDKKMNAYFSEFTFQSSSDKVLPSDKPETITKLSETSSNATEERSTVIHEIRLNKSDQALKTVPKILSTFINSAEKSVRKTCSQRSTSNTSKSVHPKPATSAKQRRNLSLPMIETEEQSSIKPNPPAKRRGRPPKNLKKIQPAPDRLLPKSSTVHPPNVVVTVSSEEILPSTTGASTSSQSAQTTQQNIRRGSENSQSTTVIPQIIQSYQAQEELRTVEPIQEPRQYIKLIDQNKLMNVQSSSCSSTNSNSRITNEIIQLLQHPNQKGKQPKQRVITLDGVIVNQDHATLASNQNVTKPSSVPELGKNTCQTTNSSITSVPIPLCTPMPDESSNTTIPEHSSRTKQCPPSIQNGLLPSQNITQNTVQTSVNHNHQPVNQEQNSSQNDVEAINHSVVQNLPSQNTSKLSNPIDLRRTINQERIQNVPAQKTNRIVEQNKLPHKNQPQPVTAGENNVNSGRNNPQVQNRPLCPKLRPHKTTNSLQNSSRLQLVLTSESNVNFGEINSQTTTHKQNSAVEVPRSSSSQEATQEQNSLFDLLVNDSNLTQNNNKSLTQNGSTSSQNNSNIPVSQNNQNIPENNLNPVENNPVKVKNITHLQNLASVAKSGSLREKKEKGSTRRQPNQNMSHQSQIDVILDQNHQNGTPHSQNNNHNNINLVVQYQNNLNANFNNQALVPNGSTQQQNNTMTQRGPRGTNLNVIPITYPQGQINVGQNNHQLMNQNGTQMVQNNSIVPVNQRVQNYAPISYPHLIPLQSSTLPQYPQQMGPTGNMPNYPNNQMASNNLQYPYRMVHQMPMYRTHITHAVHEPVVFNNMDYARMNMNREAFDRQFYDQIRNEMLQRNETLPSYDEFLQSHQNPQSVQQSPMNRLPAPLPVHRLNHQGNHPMSELNSMLHAFPAHSSRENHSSSNLPQRFPAHSSNPQENHPRSHLQQQFHAHSSLENYPRSQMNYMRQQPFHAQSSLENYSRSNLPQPFSAHSPNSQANHRTRQLSSMQQPFPAHSSLENRSRSNLPQPFPAHSSNPQENHHRYNLNSLLSPRSSQSSNHSNVATENQPITLASLLQNNTTPEPSINCTNQIRPSLLRPNLREIEILHNLEQIAAHTENSTNSSRNSSLTTPLQPQSYHMESVSVSEASTVIQPLRPVNLRTKKSSSAQENSPPSQIQAEVYNPALRNVSRDSGYFSPSDIALQAPEANVICDRCLAPSNLMCSGCFIYYCSRECQQLAWPEHMTKCSLVSPPNN